MNESSEPDILFQGPEWFDQNKGKLFNGALAVILAVVAYLWFTNKQASSNATSESALFAVQNEGLTNLVEIAGAYSRVSTEQAGKPVAERALILSARTWLEAANYEKAQAAFNSYLEKHTDGHWANEAKLGQAICQEAKGYAAAAISTYQSLTNNERLQELQIALLEAEDEAERERIERELKRLQDEPPAAIQNRATALLEAAQTKLGLLVAKPKPAPVPKPEALKPATPAAPPAPAAPDNK